MTRPSPLLTTLSTQHSLLKATFQLKPINFLRFSVFVAQSLSLLRKKSLIIASVSYVTYEKLK